MKIMKVFENKCYEKLLEYKGDTQDQIEAILDLKDSGFSCFGLEGIRRLIYREDICLTIDQRIIFMMSWNLVKRILKI